MPVDTPEGLATEHGLCAAHGLLDIDWDIEVSAEADMVACSQPSGGTAEVDEAATAGAGWGDSTAAVAALRIVEDAAYRGTLVNQLLELKACLAQRRAQTARSSAVMVHTGDLGRGAGGRCMAQLSITFDGLALMTHLQPMIDWLGQRPSS